MSCVANSRVISICQALVTRDLRLKLSFSGSVLFIKILISCDVKRPQFQSADQPKYNRNLLYNVFTVYHVTSSLKKKKSW